MRSPERILFTEPVVEAAGGLVWWRGRDGHALAVIHRPKQDDWSLPKGKLEPGETFTEAALREVAEETGCLARLGAFAGYTLYRSRRGPKLVLFWHMAAEGGLDFEPNGEVDELEWLAPEEATARLDYEEERRLVHTAARVKAIPSGKDVGERVSRRRIAPAG